MKILAQKNHGFIVEIPDAEMQQLLEEADVPTDRLEQGSTIKLSEGEAQ